MHAAEEFRHTIERAGLTAPETIHADGQLHRFASNGDREDDAGWYVYFPDGLPAGAFGCWRTGLTQKWCAKADTQMTVTERSLQRKRLEEARRQRDHEEQRRHADAAHRAQSIWESAKAADPLHPYLKKKHVQTHGLRTDSQNQLIVPVLIDETIASLEFINTDGDKKFLPGGRVRGGFCPLGDVDKTDTILLCEGFATAASLCEATHALTLCAFFAHNLMLVAQQLRQQFPEAVIILAADNDIHHDSTPNAGLLAATAAAKAIDGILAIPELDGKKCDFNDLAQARGLDAVRAAIEAVLTREDAATMTTATDAPEEMPDNAPEPDAPSVEIAEPERESPVAFRLVTAPDSFITRYIQYAGMRTDAPLEAHEAMAFGILSALASTIRLPIATSVKGWPCALWFLFLVNSTVGRKTTALDLAADVITSVLGEAAILSWEGSPQGFLQKLQTRDGQASVYKRDEYSGLMAQMNRGGHLAGLPQLFIKAYDGAVLENIRTRKRGADGETHSDTDRVDNPYFIQLAAAVWDHFIERATIDNVMDGFIPRFNILLGAVEGEGRRLAVTTDQIREATAQVYAQAQAYYTRAQAIQQVAMAPAVLDHQWDLERGYQQRAKDSARPDAAGPSLKRLAETALKLSALLAIEEASGTVLSIRDEHFSIAAAITNKWAGNALRLIEALGRTTFLKECEAVLQTIQQRPAGFPLGQLYRVHQRLRQRDFEEILSALEAQERIAIGKADATGRGRPAVLVQALNGV